MKKYLLGLLFLLLGLTSGFSQGFAFGVKGGLTVGFQQWNSGVQRDALLTYHGIAFVESVPENNAFSVFAQLGYNNRGGAIRSRAFSYIDPVTGSERRFSGNTTNYIFNNVALSLGGKQKYDFRGGDTKVYYLIGIRGEYTANTNLDIYEERNRLFGSLFYPEDQFVQRFNYGAIIGGGFEFPLTDLIGMILEFTVNPDFSKQYRQPPIPNVYNPFTMQPYDLPSQELSNTSLELTVGFRFWRKVEYID